MNLNIFSFKKSLTFTSLLVLGSLLTSPTVAMEDHNDLNEFLSAPVVLTTASRDIEALLEQANKGDEEAQNTLIAMDYAEEDFDGYGEFTADRINLDAFMENFNERFLQNPQYAHFFLKEFESVRNAYITSIARVCESLNDDKIPTPQSFYVPEESLNDAKFPTPQSSPQSFYGYFAKKFAASLIAKETCPEREKKRYADDLYNLGVVCYANSQRTRPASYVIWEKAAEAGHIKAAHKLGTFYFSSSKTTSDLEKAQRYLLQAAKGGNMNAMFTLHQYYSRKGDKETAILCLQKSAERGSSPAAELLQLLRK
jgi:hypothetical protein